MGHTKATADRYYYMEEKLNAATRAAEKLPVVMRTACPNPKTRNMNSMPANSKHSFSSEEVEKLRTVFSDELSSKSITMSKVTQKVGQLSMPHLNSRQVYDKLRQLYQQVPSTATLTVDVPRMSLNEKIQKYMAEKNDLPTYDSDPDFIPDSISSINKSNNKFSLSDLKMINVAFARIIESKSVKEAEVQCIISSNKYAKLLTQKFSVASFKNCLEYEIRKQKGNSA